MSERILICIGCPLGCRLSAELDGETVVSVSGNTCKRGDEYARRECTAPERTVCGTVRILGAALAPTLPVRTVRPVPKDKVMAVAEEMRRCTIHAPVTIGDTVLADVAGTGVDLIATRTLAAEN